MATQPTSNFDFQNFYSSTLSADITSGSLTISINTVPTPTEGILILEPDSATNREIIYYTSKGASTVVCPSDGRGWDGTTAVAHLTGTVVIMAPVAYMLRMLKSGSLFDNTITGWTTLGTTPTYLQNNGNKEFVLTSGVDKTGILSQGMKVKFNRGTTPPTQAMSFTAASSQYATKASPTGITFTSAFTCEAWVYLNSYAGQNQMIINRFDNTAGWNFDINTSGQLEIQYSTASTYTNTLSYQSIPLKRWVHVAGVVSSVASKTVALYINGVLVPSSQNPSGATSMTQPAVDLRVGNQSSGVTNRYFDGYISEARVWSVAQSQANIQANMAISLTGSETNLVALFQGNGNFNDLTTNANTLTATAGAIATQAANPYNATEYGIITKVTSTQITVFTGTDYNIPNQTLNSFYYSTQRAPFGFPTARGKWIVDFLSPTNLSMVVSANTWTNGNGQSISVPTGDWVISFEGNFISALSGTFVSMKAALSTSTSSADIRLQGNIGGYSQSTTQITGALYRVAPISQTSATTWYLNLYSSSTGTTLYYAGADAPILIQAESAYI